MCRPGMAWHQVTPPSNVRGVASITAMNRWHHGRLEYLQYISRDWCETSVSPMLHRNPRVVNFVVICGTGPTSDDKFGMMTILFSVNDNFVKSPGSIRLRRSCPPCPRLADLSENAYELSEWQLWHRWWLRRFHNDNPQYHQRRKNCHYDNSRFSVYEKTESVSNQAHPYTTKHEPWAYSSICTVRWR